MVLVALVQRALGPRPLYMTNALNGVHATDQRRADQVARRTTVGYAVGRPEWRNR
jgi:hypothetical protein